MDVSGGLQYFSQMVRVLEAAEQCLHQFWVLVVGFAEQVRVAGLADRELAETAVKELGHVDVEQGLGHLPVQLPQILLA